LTLIDQPTYTVAQLKGRRLRMLRALTGFSRQELYAKMGIATSTMDTWESGRVELTEKSSKRVCLAFRKVGICCAPEWLLTGSGIPPRTMDDVEKSIFLSNASNISNDSPLAEDNCIRFPPFLDEDIRRELSFFINLHHNSIFHILVEDYTNFRYKRGDCVAGIVENLRTLINKMVIVQLEDSTISICRLSNRTEGDNFFYVNKSNERMVIKKAAEIIWHRIPKG
jgi:transcriptional regulator with XRE-family HTH domain